jgi:RNA polymerase sigma-70 factor (ECF subfamily)
MVFMNHSISEKENISSLSDAEILDLLLQKLAEGDMDALRDLYERVSSAVYTFALSVVQNPTTAEDVMQDAFVNIAQNANKYVSQGKPMAWIMTITKNIALMKLKRMDNRNSSLEDYMDVAKTDDFAQSDRRLMLRKALSELKDEDRQIVILHAMTGMKHREIAEIMKIPLPTVLTKYKRSLEKMRRTIGGDDIE